MAELDSFVVLVPGLHVPIEAKRRRPEAARMPPAECRARDDADRVHLDRVVRTIESTARTADAPVLDDDLPVVAFMDRADRTADQADRVLALPARRRDQIILDALVVVHLHARPI